MTECCERGAASLSLLNPGQTGPETSPSKRLLLVGGMLPPGPPALIEFSGGGGM